jgi:outer membrane protein assembly factor BamE (lipoprotein component of BamABCDE complex)
MNSAEEPGDAYAKAFTQNRWFYIENTDMASKQAFSFLQLLLSLAETEAPDRGPVLTISN